MPAPVNRESLTKTLEGRYTTQHAGGAFDVKQTLGGPGTHPARGVVIDATSLQGSNFQNPNGFEVGVLETVTQLKEAQGTTSKELSLYIRGFSNRRYSPSGRL
jgi:hypothetical protein